MHGSNRRSRRRNSTQQDRKICIHDTRLNSFLGSGQNIPRSRGLFGRYSFHTLPILRLTFSTVHFNPTSPNALHHERLPILQPSVTGNLSSTKNARR